MKNQNVVISELHDVLLRWYNRYLFCLQINFVFPLIFCNALFAMDSPDIISSRRHPKYSPTEHCLILFSFLVIFKAEYFYFPFLNKIYLVLSFLKCIESLLSTNHSHRILKSTFRCFSIELTFSLLKRRQASSAYSLKSQSVTADLKSFTYNKKSIGPKMDP